MSRKKKRRIIPFETQNQPLLSRKGFAKRLALSFGLATLIIMISLFGGMVGYRTYESMSWLDAFVNASMILSGMGPISGMPTTNAGKFFAGMYALYSGLIVVLASGIILAPLVHRILHRFHLHPEDDTEGQEHQQQPG